MNDVVINEKSIEKIVLEWEQDLSQEEVLELSNKWLLSKNFLTSHIVGLSHVGESGLTIQPEEEPS